MVLRANESGAPSQTVQWAPRGGGASRRAAPLEGRLGGAAKVADPAPSCLWLRPGAIRRPAQPLSRHNAERIAIAALWPPQPRPGTAGVVALGLVTMLSSVTTWSLGPVTTWSPWSVTTWSLGPVTTWSLGLSRHGALALYDMEPWACHDMEPRACHDMEPWPCHDMEPWPCHNMEPLACHDMEPRPVTTWSLGLSQHGALGLSRHGALALSRHGASALSQHGALGLSQHGSAAPTAGLGAPGLSSKPPQQHPTRHSLHPTAVEH
ncbi:uncharacterized protein LOC116652603 [Coturnix japonica]|uniref:uncharacterized protein LOC116652603 n=1 Tax=Coturnix japonica TaxID=93934 RepID=UPI0013A5CD43|nr:uncharacterized protein LOC116652603 [Coturnix japonica]